jgi:hypothetical protein
LITYTDQPNSGNKERIIGSVMVGLTRLQNLTFLGSCPAHAHLGPTMRPRYLPCLLTWDGPTGAGNGNPHHVYRFQIYIMFCTRSCVFSGWGRAAPIAKYGEDVGIRSHDRQPQIHQTYGRCVLPPMGSLSHPHELVDLRLPTCRRVVVSSVSMVVLGRIRKLVLCRQI